MAKLKDSKRMEQSFNSACKQAIKAFSEGQVPYKPVILLGDGGFYFGDEDDEAGHAVCTYIDEDETGEAGCDEPCLPDYRDVLAYIYGCFEQEVNGSKSNVQKAWNAAMDLIEKDGTFSVLFHHPTAKSTPKGFSTRPR